MPGRRDAEKRLDLVLEGGGVKGVALVGALAVLEEEGYIVQNRAGTSAGAVVAALSAAGYSAVEIRDEVFRQGLSQFVDTGWEDRIPLLGAPISILKDFGIYEGDVLQREVERLLAAKGVTTFANLIYDPAGEPRYRHKVQMIASDLTERRLLVLPRDAGLLGVAPDDLNVALAVRMSLSIPLFFEPVRFRNPATGREHLIVDGGLLSNFPVWLFDSPGTPAWPTFGLRLVDAHPEEPLGQYLPLSQSWDRVGAVMTFLTSIIQTLLEAHDRLYIERANFARTIPIPTSGISSTDFQLTAAQTADLYETGRAAAQEFLRTWDFAAYIAAFRSGKDTDRTRAVVAEMKRAKARR